MEKSYTILAEFSEDKSIFDLGDVLAALVYKFLDIYTYTRARFNHCQTFLFLALLRTLLSFSAAALVVIYLNVLSLSRRAQ